MHFVGYCPCFSSPALLPSILFFVPLFSHLISFFLSLPFFLFFCSADASGRSIWVAGTNDGVFVKSSPTSEFLRGLPLERVAQVRVLQSQGTVIVLGGKSQELITYPLSLLDPATCGEAAGEAVTVPNSDGTSLFEHGVKGGKEYIALVKVKAEQGKTSLKLYEPVAQVGKKKERLAAVKKFIIGSEVVSVRFFPLALCLGTRLGFEILDIDSSQVDSTRGRRGKGKTEGKGKVWSRVH